MTLTDQNRRRTNMARNIGEWWYVIWDKDGQSVLAGPYNSQAEATNRGMLGKRRDGTPYVYDVKSYPTKDRALATQMYKMNRLDSGQDLDSSLERMGHQVPNEGSNY